MIGYSLLRWKDLLESRRGTTKESISVLEFFFELYRVCVVNGKIHTLKAQAFIL